MIIHLIIWRQGQPMQAFSGVDAAAKTLGSGIVPRGPFRTLAKDGEFHEVKPGVEAAWAEFIK